MRMDMMATIALFVAIIGMLLVLAALSSNVGSHWGTVETNMASLVVLVAMAVVCVAFAARKVL